MKLPTFDDIVPVDETDAERFKKLVGRNGQVFIQFMLDNNGVSPAAYRCEVVIEGKGRFPLQSIKRVGGMLSYREVEMEYLHPYKNYLCFALGPSSHEEFLYRLDDDGRDEVWLLYRDQEFEVGEEIFPEGEGMVKLADDFSIFLSLLEVEPEEE